MEAFRHGGGISYSEMGEEIPAAIERFFGPGYRSGVPVHRGGGPR